MNRPTPRPVPGGEETFARAAKVPLLGGVRGGFMVPVHDHQTKEVLHEPEGAAPPPPGPARQGQVNRAGPEDGAPIMRFMVPKHTRKRLVALPACAGVGLLRHFETRCGLPTSAGFRSNAAMLETD